MRRGTVVVMRMRTALATAATGFVGAAGAIVGFQQLAPVAQAEDAAGAAAGPAAAGAVPVTKVRFKPCDEGFQRQGAACVRILQET